MEFKEMAQRIKTAAEALDFKMHASAFEGLKYFIEAFNPR
jgi:hypothetical protein